MWLLFSFPQKEKKQQIKIATDADHSCFFAWLKRKKSKILNKKVLDNSSKYRLII